MRFKYMTGEDVLKGDYVTYHREPGRVDFVAEPSIDDPETAWYVKEFGGGVMILEPKAFGSVFLTEPDSDEDLILVSRAGSPPERLSQTEQRT
jgi:hypothetical protein